MNKFTNALGLDVGAARIGVARVNSIALLPEPLCVLPNNAETTSALREIISVHRVDLLVVGYPRNMNGEKTAQTAYIEEYAQAHLSDLGVPFVYHDETLSTIEASKRVRSGRYPKELEDAVAASVILEDYVRGMIE